MSQYYTSSSTRNSGQQNAQPSLSMQHASSEFTELETDLEEKIAKEKAMCSQINGLKEDLERKLRELDENKNIFLADSLTRQKPQQTVFQATKQRASPLRSTATASQQPKPTTTTSFNNRVIAYTSLMSSPKRAFSPVDLQGTTFPSESEVTKDHHSQLQSKDSEILKREITRLKQGRGQDEDRIVKFQKDIISLTASLKGSQEKCSKLTELVKDLEWENEKLLDEITIKESKLKAIDNNDHQVREAQAKFESKVYENQALQRQIDSINEKHQQFKQQMLARDDDIKSEIKTSELIINQQEQEITRLKHQIDELNIALRAFMHEQQTSIDIEEDWKNEVSLRIRKEKEVTDIQEELERLKEDGDIKNVQIQAKILLLFAENERLHQILMNSQMEVKVAKGQIQQYQQQTMNMQLNTATKPIGSGNASEEIDKLKLHLQLKLKENELLRAQVTSLESCPAIISDLERKLQVQIAENKKYNTMMFCRIAEKW